VYIFFALEMSMHRCQTPAYLSVLSEARIRDGVRAVTMLWCAFDKTVSRKPLAFAVDVVYGNSIDSGLEVIAKKGLARKACY